MPGEPGPDSGVLAVACRVKLVQQTCTCSRNKHFGKEKRFHGRIPGLKRAGNVIYLDHGTGSCSCPWHKYSGRKFEKRGDFDRWRQSHAAAHANRTRRRHPRPFEGPASDS